MRSRRLLGLHAAPSRTRRLSSPAVHGHRPAGQVDVQVLADLDLELAAVELHGHRASRRRAARGRPRRRSRRCPRTASPPPRARRCARGSRRRLALGARTETFVRLGKSSWCSIGGPSALQVERLELVGSATSIAHCGLPIETCWKREARAGAIIAAPSAGPPGSRRAAARAAHVHRAGGRPGDRRAGSRRRRSGSRTCRVSVQPSRRRYRIASRAPLPDSSASEPSGLKIRRRGDEAGLVGARRAAARRRAPTPVCGSQSRRTRAGRELERQLVALDDQVVVAERLPLLERSSSAGVMPCISARDVRRVAAGDVDQRDAGELAHPGELALGVAARAALHRLDVAGAAAPRSRAPCARCPTRRPRAPRAPPRARRRRPSRRRGRRCGA